MKRPMLDLQCGDLGKAVHVKTIDHPAFGVFNGSCRDLHGFGDLFIQLARYDQSQNLAFARTQTLATMIKSLEPRRHCSVVLERDAHVGGHSVNADDFLAFCDHAPCRDSEYPTITVGACQGSKERSIPDVAAFESVLDAFRGIRIELMVVAQEASHLVPDDVGTAVTE